MVESRAFFGVRAATWDTRFGDDLPAYAAAVAEAGLRPGWTVLDVGCGTGRALPALRAVVGPGAPVLGIDLTPQMLEVARANHRDAHAALVLGDARRLPVADAGADAVFAAGLVAHLPDAAAGFVELARVTRPGGRLVLFHPTGRAALAARHGRTVRADEPLEPGPARQFAARRRLAARSLRRRAGPLPGRRDKGGHGQPAGRVTIRVAISRACATCESTSETRAGAVRWPKSTYMSTARPMRIRTPRWLPGTPVSPR